MSDLQVFAIRCAGVGMLVSFALAVLAFAHWPDAPYLVFLSVLAFVFSASALAAFPNR